MKFSIIIPTYNRADRIKKAIQSVLIQDYSDFELIIIDDGSVDNTNEVVSQFRDHRIRYIYQANSERGAARNHGIAQSQGEYVTFLDSDDQLYSNHLSEASTMIKENASPQWFHLRYEIRDQVGNLISTSPFVKGNASYLLLKGNPLSCMGVFVKKEVISVNFFREERALAGSEDWELWVRLACKYPLIICECITSRLNHHDHRSVLENDPKKIVDRILLAERIVLSSECVKKNWRDHLGLIKAHLLGYLVLHLTIMKQRRMAMRYLGMVLVSYWPFIFTRKFLVILKHLLVP